MLLLKLAEKKLINPPRWILDNSMYLTIMGSVAYGVSADTSDMDVYGFCIPPKDHIFPHLRGEILGFGTPGERFEYWQQHHIRDSDSRKEYDIAIYSIVKYFNLCLENNPNMIDSLFTPRRCVIHSTPVSEHVRENRRIFLHKGAFHKFRGYSFAQMTKIRNKTNSSNEKRKATIDNYGFDLKFAYHVVRLALEAEQILMHYDLDLERDREILKSIRRGEWSLEQLESWFQEKEKALETLYVNSRIPDAPDENGVKKILMECLESHYGRISKEVIVQDSGDNLIKDLEKIIQKYKKD